MRIYASGDRVTQPQYGPGTVTSANAQHTVIDFDGHGSRRFVTSMVMLEATTQPAPRPSPKPKARRRTPAP
jgi:hypothetical protein